MRGRQLFQLFKPSIRLITACFQILPSGFCRWLLLRLRYSKGLTGLGFRYALLKKLAISCGDNVSVHDAVVFRYPEKLKLGKNISIHPFCYVDAQGEIEIGDDVSIAHNVSILSFEHDFSDIDMPIKDAPCVPYKITIENDTWIGAGVRILGGVRIGAGSVIGAGAVVTKDVPAYSVAVGVPAKVIKNRRNVD